MTEQDILKHKMQQKAYSDAVSKKVLNTEIDLLSKLNDKQVALWFQLIHGQFGQQSADHHQISNEGYLELLVKMEAGETKYNLQQLGILSNMLFSGLQWNAEHLSLHEFLKFKIDMMVIPLLYQDTLRMYQQEASDETQNNA